jgi:ElaB/YqjD/DUF883 family membrane-anchored ribosome-binding protein
MVDKASAVVKDLAGQAGEFADRAIEEGREAGAMVQRAPGAMRDALHTSLKQQPMPTLAIAGVLGFLLGVLWKS